jgi:hypothetical protein
MSVRPQSGHSLSSGSHGGTTGRASTLADQFVGSHELRMDFPAIFRNALLRRFKVLRGYDQPAFIASTAFVARGIRSHCARNTGIDENVVQFTQPLQIAFLSTAEFSMAFAISRFFSSCAFLYSSCERRIAQQSAHFSICGRYSMSQSGHILFLFIVRDRESKIYFPAHYISRAWNRLEARACYGSCERAGVRTKCEMHYTRPVLLVDTHLPLLYRWLPFALQQLSALASLG